MAWGKMSIISGFLAKLISLNQDIVQKTIFVQMANEFFDLLINQLFKIIVYHKLVS